MKGIEFAGRLKQRVEVLRRETGQDAIGAPSTSWMSLGHGWAEVAQLRPGPAVAGAVRAALPRWRVTLRSRDLSVGDRLVWQGRRLGVVEVERDPLLPGRMTAMTEEERA